ncbi:MAG: pyridoxamine 5'-phosphate oxidase family protein [Pseudomonadales bacterium]|nr:pyridoxamine 5'-phosphate oxidase family protein [Pseudomonadales bacterium]
MTRMTDTERQAFLADLHVGVVAIPEPGRGPLCVPVWYDYRPGGEIRFITGIASRKGRLLDPGLRISLCAQTETPPYQYVSVEGPIVGLDPVGDELVPMAVRYLGETQGRAYAAGSSGADDVLVRVRPERWLAVDYGKGSG